VSGTYSQIYIQIVFAVQSRQCLIAPSWEDVLHKYISGIIRNKNQKLLAIKGMPDHIHIFVGMKPSCCLSDLVRELKKSSNEFVKDKKLSKYPFSWQEGYGAFSYHYNLLDTIIKYINNQKIHHSNKSFRREYLELLEEFGIEFKDEYLFHWIES
jgi:putative transposase